MRLVLLQMHLSMYLQLALLQFIHLLSRCSKSKKLTDQIHGDQILTHIPTTHAKLFFNDYSLRTRFVFSFRMFFTENEMFSDINIVHKTIYCILKIMNCTLFLKCLIIKLKNYFVQDCIFWFHSLANVTNLHSRVRNLARKLKLHFQHSFCYCPLQIV